MEVVSSSCACLCVSSSGKRRNTNTHTISYFCRNVGKRRQLNMKQQRIGHLGNPFLSSAKMVSCCNNSRKRQKKLQLQRFIVVDELGGQYDDTFNDVKKELVSYFTFKAVRTVLEQLYEMNPPQYMWFNKPRGTGHYDKFYEEGLYNCAGCGTPLYKSTTKFDSGCGWPAFFEGLPGAITRSPDPDGRRTEITCTACGGHLGHVFKGEGHPVPTDERHCVNSVSIKFVTAAGAPPAAP